VSLDWPALEKLLGEGNAAGVLAGVRDLDDKQRRALAGPLQEYAKRWWSARDRSDRWYGTAPALTVATGSCLAPGAAVTWLPHVVSASFAGMARGGPGFSDSAVLQVLRTRPPAWREDVALRLADGMGKTDYLVLRELAVALVAETGVEPPATAGFADAWMSTVAVPWGDSLPDALREDPLLPHAHRLLFEPDDAGPLLGRWGPWPEALVTLAGEGRLDRGVLIGACLGRLLRGGTPAQLRAYTQVYEGLRVSVDEAAARAGDLLSLLPDAPPTVAALAQAELRRIDEAGRLAAGALAEACRAALFRPEQKLAAAQLSWLRAAIKRDPGQAPGLLSTVAVAFAHPAPEIQQKAVALLARHAKLLDAEARARASAAAGSLPGDLRGRIGGILGEDPAAGDAPGPAGLAAAQAGLAPQPFIPAGVPAAVGSAAELAEEVAAILQAIRDGWPDRGLNPVVLERVLAGLVAWAHADRAGVAAALAPVCRRWEIHLGPRLRMLPSFSGKYWPQPVEMLVFLIGAAAGQQDPARVPDWAGEVAAISGMTGPLRVLELRLLEIASGLAGPVPMLVAAPTAATGHVDPAVLLARLEQAASQGWQPWEHDLQQALLRLPRDTEPRIAAVAGRLGTPAGSRLAGWLNGGGLPDLALQRIRGTFEYPDGATGTALVVVPAGPRPAVPPAAGSLAGILLNLPDPRQETVLLNEGADGADYRRPLTRTEARGPLTRTEVHGVHRGVDWADCWPAVAPSHRDLIAAWGVRGSAELLLLAEADGPAGPGISLAIANCLSDSSDEEESGAATVDAMLALARRGQLNGAAVGADIAGLMNRWDPGQLKRVARRLRDAARAGAEAQVWDAIAAALPPLLTAAQDWPAYDPSLASLADLVALGTEVAPGTAKPIPELAIYSGQKKRTRLVAEARRMHTYLTQTTRKARYRGDG
jgi:hypothetical protein